MRGEYQKAIAEYDEALRLKPDDADAYAARGLVHYDLGEYQKAIADYDEALLLKPSYARAYGNRCRAYSHLGQYQRAIADCDRAVGLAPDGDYAHDSRGEAYTYAGRYEDAVSDFNVAIDLSPDGIHFLGRALAYYRWGEYKSAASDYNVAFLHQTGEPKTFEDRRNTYEKLAAVTPTVPPTAPPPSRPPMAVAAVSPELAPPPARPPRQPRVHEKRIALVVGNSAYEHVPRLGNPANDARLMARTLRSLGFTLVGGEAQVDLAKQGFDRDIQAFGDQLPGATVALFYYAGHGMQVQGENFLVPVSANPEKEADTDFQLVDMQAVLDEMEDGRARLNVVILDACRNNPFRSLTRAANGGLGEIKPPKGTLILYSTAPGAVAQDGDGPDSPFTQALAQQIVQPGDEIREVFNDVGLVIEKQSGGSQIPWQGLSPIEGKFYFAGGPI